VRRLHRPHRHPGVEQHSGFPPRGPGHVPADRGAMAGRPSLGMDASLGVRPVRRCPRRRRCRPAGTAPVPCARAATRCGAFPVVSLAPRAVLPSIAMTSRPPASAALVCSQVPGTRSKVPALTRAARAGRRTRPLAAVRARHGRHIRAGVSATRCPIAANDSGPRSRRSAGPPAHAAGLVFRAGQGAGQQDRADTGYRQHSARRKISRAGGSPRASRWRARRTPIAAPRAPPRCPQTQRHQ
jgi:hypothetical protein